MADVTLDLYPAEGGQYAVEVKVGPGKPWASLEAGSGTIYLDGAPPLESGARRLTFRQAVTYPRGLQPLREPHGSIYVYIYRPTDRDAIVAFDERVKVRYTEFFVTTGEHPAGTFDVDGLPAPCIGELAAMDAAGRAEYEPMAAALALPPDIEEIVADCRSLQDRSFERYVLWLTRPS